MRIDLITIFPQFFAALDLSLIGKAAADTGPLSLHTHDLRDYTHDKHRTVDDTPVGGGAGMVMKADVWGRAIDAAAATPAQRRVLIIPSPAGEVFTQRTAEDLATADHLIFACGRYEGIDSRVAEHYAAQGYEVREMSIGDYVLNGGESAVIVMVEAIARLIPGVVGNPESVVEESHSAAGLLEHRVYTRPTQWRDHSVPEVLRSGNHEAIRRYRRDDALTRTATRRPDMIAALSPQALDAADRAQLARLGWVVHPRTGAMTPLRCRTATQGDVASLTSLAQRTFPDACPPGMSQSDIAAHLAATLSEEHIRAWVTGEHSRVQVAEVAGELVGYCAVLDEEAPGVDSLPGCLRETQQSPKQQTREAAGGASAETTGSEPNAWAELSKIYVDAEWRGNGISAALLAQAEQAARELGCSTMWLGTWEKNKRAQRSYKRNGWRRVGSRRYQVGEQPCRDAVMVTDLPQVGQ